MPKAALLDFLSHFHLLVDVAHRRLVNPSSLLQPTLSNLALHIFAPTDAYAHLLTSYLEFSHPEPCQTPTAPAKHGIYHHIKTTRPPVFAKFRRPAPDRLAAAKEMFVEMEEMGLCQKTSSPWSSPLHIVLKKDGSLRPCWDYRRLNMQTEHRRHDMTSYLHKSEGFLHT
ncbi:uncharacterized protein [Palaemon carinicauda]|uniref:uncharacterized protein n=1 Tax=Palaemon carinicauda TaxID=392227 RepID=UPI0035B5DB68